MEESTINWPSSIFIRKEECLPAFAEEGYELVVSLVEDAVQRELPVEHLIPPGRREKLACCFAVVKKIGKEKVFRNFVECNF